MSGIGEAAALRPIIQAVVMVGVLLTPILNAGEVLALIAGAVRAQEEALTPVYIKAMKDLSLAVIAVLSLLALVLRGRVSPLVLPFLVFGLFVSACALHASATDPQLTLAGLRWIFPAFLCFLLIGQSDERLLARLATLMSALLVLHVLIQIFQLFFMSDWFGTNMLGLAGRVPGMFFIPNTASFFALSTLLLVHFHARRSATRQLVHALVPVSVFMTQSGTGVIVYALLVGLLAMSRLGAGRAAPLLVLAPLLAFAALPLLPALTGRGADYVAISGGVRVGIFMRLFESSDIFPELFGHATNTAVVFARNLAGPGEQLTAVIADSMYTSILGNLGLVGFVGFLGAVTVWGLFLLYRPIAEIYAFTLVFGLFGATTVVTEAFPMSLLFAVLFAYYAKRDLVPFLQAVMAPPSSSLRAVGGAT